MTQSAMENVFPLLKCTGSDCAQDASTLLALDVVLAKMLGWYQALYQSEIGSQLPSAPSRIQPGLVPLVRHSNPIIRMVAGQAIG